MVITYGRGGRIGKSFTSDPPNPPRVPERSGASEAKRNERRHEWRIGWVTSEGFFRSSDEAIDSPKEPVLAFCLFSKVAPPIIAKLKGQANPQQTVLWKQQKGHFLGHLAQNSTLNGLINNL